MAVMPPESPFYDGPVYVSKHAADRWDERADADSCSPEAAWHEATRLPDRACGEQADELRVHEQQAVVLVRADDTIVTVDALEGPDAEEWLRSIVYEIVGAVWTDTVGYAGGERR